MASITVSEPDGSYSLTASSAEITQGESVTISWDATGAWCAFLSLSRQFTRIYSIFDKTNPKGKIIVSPMVTTIYRLKFARRDLPDIDQNITVTVKKPVKPVHVEAPGIGYFRAYPDTITKGKSTILRWEILRADKVVLRAANDPTNKGAVMITSTYEVAPLIDTTYYLTASNAGGDTTARVDIKVIQKEKVKSPTVVSFVADKTILSSGEKVIEQNPIDMAPPTIAEDSKNIQGSENTYYWWILLIPVAWWMLGNKGGKS